MTPRGAATFISWLDARLHREKQQILALLPPDVAQKLQKISHPGPVENLLEPVADRLHSIHYSWFQPVLSQLPPSQRGAAEQALANPKSESRRSLPTMVLEYWQNWLWKQIVEQQWMPSKLIRSPDDLRGLVALNKHDLTEVIDLLGVFDAVPNLRKAIHAAEQKFWGEVLSDKQKQLAQKLLQQPAWPGQIPLAMGSISVPEAARSLHQRGCLRLGAALSGTNEPLVWNIVHHLDRGRGQLVQEAAGQRTSQEASAAARSALAMVLREFKTQGSN